MIITKSHIRKLKRDDLPKTRLSCDSLKIPVIYKNKERLICDIHFGNNNLCYLENNNGEPVKIDNLYIIETIREKIEILNYLPIIGLPKRKLEL